MLRPLTIATIMVAASAAATAEDDPLALLPAGPGQEETFYTCGSCHSIRLVVQQGLTADGWNETIDWMVDEQEMEPLEDDERALIVAYLAKNFGTDRPNFPLQ